MFNIMIVIVSRHCAELFTNRLLNVVEEVGFFNPLDGDEPEAHKGLICSRSREPVNLSEVGLAEPLG